MSASDAREARQIYMDIYAVFYEIVFNFEQ